MLTWNPPAEVPNEQAVPVQPLSASGICRRGVGGLRLSSASHGAALAPAPTPAHRFQAPGLSFRNFPNPNPQPNPAPTLSKKLRLACMSASKTTTSSVQGMASGWSWVSWGESKGKGKGEGKGNN